MQKPVTLLLSLLLGAGLNSCADRDHPLVLIKTNLGAITVKLDRQAAPLTVANFLEYVDSGFYSGTLFHRVIKGFMIQGGGLTPDMQTKPTREAIVNEAANGRSNLRGTIAMARTGEPHSATSQFFINTVNNYRLDFKSKTASGWGYCVFGEVVKGMDIVDRIEHSPTTTAGMYRDCPEPPVLIESIQRVRTGLFR